MQKGEVQLEGPDKAPVIVLYFFNYYFIKTLYLLLRMRKISVLSIFFLFTGWVFFLEILLCISGAASSYGKGFFLSSLS